VLDGGAHPGAGREVYHGIRFGLFKDLANPFAVANIHLKDARFGGKGPAVGTLGGGVVKVVEVIQNRDLVAGLEAFFNKMGANKSGASRNN
jgi:hypothetical protein